MAEQVRVKNTGLRGITVADSKISFIDGERGVLIYRGYRVEDLADHATYLETAYLLLHGRLPTTTELEAFTAAVTARRAVPEFILEGYRRWPGSAAPMDVLQASVPLLALADPSPEARTREEMADQALGLIARFPTLVAAWYRIRNGQDPVAPDESLDHAANFLYMLTGDRPDPATGRDLDVCRPCTPTTPSTPRPSPAGRWSAPGPTSTPGWPPAWAPCRGACTAGPTPG